jgi:AcrR family transcriptional regulator
MRTEQKSPAPAAKRRFQRRARQAKDKEQLREKFIEIARGEFAAHDVESVSLRRIAALAGYSQGTLYQYFPSKVALLIAVKQENFEEIVGRMRAIAATPQDGRTRLYRILLAYVDYWARHPDHFKSLFSMSGTIEDRRMPDGTLFGESPIAQAPYGIFVDAVAAFFADHGAKGERNLLRLLASTLIAAAHGAVALPLGTPSMKSPPIASMAGLLFEATLHSWEQRLRAARDTPEWPRVDRATFFQRVGSKINSPLPR